MAQSPWPRGLAIMIGSSLGISYCSGNGLIARKSLLVRTHRIPGIIDESQQTNLRRGYHRWGRGMAGGSRAFFSAEDDLRLWSPFHIRFLLTSGFTSSLKPLPWPCPQKSLPVCFDAHEIRRLSPHSPTDKSSLPSFLRLSPRLQLQSS